MAKPLFLAPVMQEKIWGGKRLAQEYGYDIPSDDFSSSQWRFDR